MNRIVLKNGNIYTHDGFIAHGWILLEDGIITAFDRGPHPACDIVIDVHHLTIMPGFIDLHVHGAVGRDTMQATRESLHMMAHYFAQHGVTSFLAATITESPALMQRAVENIAACMGPIAGGSTLLGAYLEGPYINAQAKGSHTEHYIRRAHAAEYMPLFETGAVKHVTLAPEFPENITLLKECVARGIMPTIGHTTADYDQVCAAIALGASQATHTFNAMSGLHHRAPGAVGAILANDAISAELIADMVHVHPAVVKLAIRAKGTDKILLVTDAEIGAGMQPGMYDFGRSHVQVTDTGVYLPNGVLAGSVLTMNKALYNCIQIAGLTIEQAWPMASFNAARQLGMGHKKGKLAVGYDADIVVLDPKDFRVAMTICKGAIVHDTMIHTLKDSYEKTTTINTIG